IEIDSEPGKGTTIRMLFPESVQLPAPQERPMPVIDGHGGSETILIVDDSPDVLDLAVVQLESLGYRVIQAENGEAALAVLERESEIARLNSTQPAIDLLFTDIVMPGGINGLKLAERAAALIPGLPVLLATGYIEDLVASGPRAVGMDVIGKPYRKSELSARVRASLDGRNRKPAAERQPRPHKEA
ncbi:MAG TPA: response regulator, partial [Acetobacteraceae bacterium]|nr:response regulator [Acetobacteraceae bacterium]